MPKVVKKNVEKVSGKELREERLKAICEILIKNKKFTDQEIIDKVNKEKKFSELKPLLKSRVNWTRRNLNHGQLKLLGYEKPETPVQRIWTDEEKAEKAKKRADRIAKKGGKPAKASKKATEKKAPVTKKVAKKSAKKVVKKAAKKVSKKVVKKVVRKSK